MCELAEWLDFWRLEPWGAEADDTRHGNVAAAVVNQYRRGKPLGAEAFRVRFESAQQAERRRENEVVEKGIPIMRELVKRSEKAAADGR